VLVMGAGADVHTKAVGSLSMDGSGRGWGSW